MIKEFIQICKEDTKRLYVFNFYFALFSLGGTLGAYLGIDKGFPSSLSTFCYGLMFFLVVLVGVLVAMHQVISQYTKTNPE